MKYQVTFVSGKAEMEFGYFADAMTFCASYHGEFYIWRTESNKASKLLVHGSFHNGIER